MPTELASFTPSSIISSVTTIGEGLLGFATSAFNWAINNPVYLLYIGIGLFMVGFGIVRKVIHR